MNRIMRIVFAVGRVLRPIVLPLVRRFLPEIVDGLTQVLRNLASHTSSRVDDDMVAAFEAEREILIHEIREYLR